MSRNKISFKTVQRFLKTFLSQNKTSFKRIERFLENFFVLIAKYLIEMELNMDLNKIFRKYFKFIGDLNRHLRSIHLQLKPILCSHCHKKFAKEETLLRHMNATHRDLVEDSLQSK